MGVGRRRAEVGRQKLRNKKQLTAKSQKLTTKTKKMTHHYIIEIIKLKIFLKATYRNGKFRKLERLRGKIDRKIMDALGKVIPISEEELPTLTKAYFGKVGYKIDVKKEQSLFTQFLNEWFYFYEDLTNLKPKFTGADGNALKQIISYFKQQTTTEEEALETWKVLLGNWEYLSAFHRKQIDLKYINSKLNVIIREIKQKNSTNLSGTNRSVEL